MDFNILSAAQVDLNTIEEEDERGGEKEEEHEKRETDIYTPVILIVLGI